MKSILIICLIALWADGRADYWENEKHSGDIKAFQFKRVRSDDDCATSSQDSIYFVYLPNFPSKRYLNVTVRIIASRRLIEERNVKNITIILSGNNINWQINTDWLKKRQRMRINVYHHNTSRVINYKNKKFELFAYPSLPRLNFTSLKSHVQRNIGQIQGFTYLKKRRVDYIEIEPFTGKKFKQLGRTCSKFSSHKIIKAYKLRDSLIETKIYKGSKHTKKSEDFYIFDVQPTSDNVILNVTVKADSGPIEAKIYIRTAARAHKSKTKYHINLNGVGFHRLNVISDENSKIIDPVVIPEDFQFGTSQSENNTSQLNQDQFYDYIKKTYFLKTISKVIYVKMKASIINSELEQKPLCTMYDCIRNSFILVCKEDAFDVSLRYLILRALPNLDDFRFTLNDSKCELKKSANGYDIHSTMLECDSGIVTNDYGRHFSNSIVVRRRTGKDSNWTIEHQMPFVCNYPTSNKGVQRVKQTFKEETIIMNVSFDGEKNENDAIINDGSAMVVNLDIIKKPEMANLDLGPSLFNCYIELLKSNKDRVYLIKDGCMSEYLISRNEIRSLSNRKFEVIFQQFFPKTAPNAVELVCQVGICINNFSKSPDSCISQKQLCHRSRNMTDLPTIRSAPFIYSGGLTYNKKEANEFNSKVKGIKLIFHV
ncbi:DgyrCDS7135 [Dimorphilus gyrociliatus]|uniref:DgyrCDS7135 n=1 Tax=Dimorphilus gyrociliatus TaxID=2664684 RepID=A0A7I8VQ45_9ANNE|nr:DgyrCDS7135 [Dimorphilus gyrociliatus]